ncbi:SRPBCC family protein [Devosia rhizoryzae]|uniref:SRPBCC family protein n=1 Tax=Devosia rhizoryzae TaxID=2774137 RepID=A0ABX7C357_9HYPH|nr:SRPBCC family protein [Devosia rhizoryzae]QQR38675.1 SRPBCC family protein [Devosia rhizoryzae]
MSHHNHDDAPKRTQKDDKDGDLAIVGRSVTINRPRQELFAFWRDFTNLSQFMEAIESIQMTGENRSAWTVRAPAGQTVTLETETVDVVEGEQIGWRSVEGSQIETKGKVSFTDAPEGRGTVVSAEIGYVPPAGDLGRLVAKLFAAEPNIQARHELKRFKMLMETGEIATGSYYRDQKDNK